MYRSLSHITENQEGYIPFTYPVVLGFLCFLWDFFIDFIVYLFFALGVEWQKKAQLHNT